MRMRDARGEELRRIRHERVVNRLYESRIMQSRLHKRAALSALLFRRAERIAGEIGGG